MEIWNSDKLLFQNKFLAIIDRNGYTFSREVRCAGIIIAILPFRITNGTKEFLARVEICPAHGPKPEQCCITGGLEPDETMRTLAKRELWEEAGFQVTAEEFIDLGQVRPSKSSDTVAYIFAIDVTKKQQFNAVGDGTPLEATGSVEWVNYELGIQVQDPLFITAMARLLEGGIYGTSRH